MSNLGMYQWMTEEAANAGGPEKWLELIKQTAYADGASAMKKELSVPFIGTVVAVGAVSLLLGQQLQKWITNKEQKRLITARRADKAEARLKAELSDAADKIQPGAEREIIRGENKDASVVASDGHPN